jgi:hypothetical protein
MQGLPVKEKHFWKALLLFAAVTLSFVVACRSVKTEVSQETAINAARQEAYRRGWRDIQIEEASFNEGRWQIIIWREPKTPGGFATVQVSRDGKILRFVPGK